MNQVQQQTLKEATFIGACRQFFGLKQGQTLKEFGDEIKCLSDKDRTDLTDMFTFVGFKIVKSPGQ